MPPPAPVSTRAASSGWARARARRAASTAVGSKGSGASRVPDRGGGGGGFPAPGQIEAESVKAVQDKMQANDDPQFQTRAIVIKEQRAELAKHHVSVLWSDYFKPPHFESYPQLHQLVNDTLKALSAAKGSSDPATGQKALDLIAEIDRIFWETKKA
ncbi:superoxide dismutase, Ni [Streptomyces albidoflavus]|nr:superoxide dismutase, Ni [Streptomyces albidoflavus]